MAQIMNLIKNSQHADHQIEMLRGIGPSTKEVSGFAEPFPKRTIVLT